MYLYANFTYIHTEKLDFEALTFQSVQSVHPLYTNLVLG